MKQTFDNLHCDLCRFLADHKIDDEPIVKIEGTEEQCEKSSTQQSDVDIKTESHAMDASIDGSSIQKSSMEETVCAEMDTKEIENEQHLTEVDLGLYERVVPLCNHLVMDRLPKNLKISKIDSSETDEMDADVFIANITRKDESVDNEVTQIKLDSVSEGKFNNDILMQFMFEIQYCFPCLF